MESQKLEVLKATGFLTSLEKKSLKIKMKIFPSPHTAAERYMLFNITKLFLQKLFLTVL